MGKPTGKDLLKGVLTLPAIIFLEHHPDNEVIKRVCTDKTDEEEVKKAMEMIRQSSSLDECYEIARGFCSRASLALEGLPPNPAQQSFFDLARYIIQREK